MQIEYYTLKELENKVKSGSNFKLLKPFRVGTQVLINTQKILTEKDIYKMDGKFYGKVEVIPSVDVTINNQLIDLLISNCLKIFQKNKIFSIVSAVKRKVIEKNIRGIFSGHPYLCAKVKEILAYSQKLFIHSVNVTLFSLLIDNSLQNKNSHHDGIRVEEIFMGALLHDIGFLFLPKELTEKKLYEFDPEMELHYKLHPETGAEHIANEPGHTEIRPNSILIIKQHHERTTGTGFPQKLKGPNIHLYAKIVGLADEFDMIITKQIAEHNKPITEIMSRISRSGGLFSKDIVNALYDEFRSLR